MNFNAIQSSSLFMKFGFLCAVIGIVSEILGMVILVKVSLIATGMFLFIGSMVVMR